jgi:SAM-dependent methyltransferase
MNSYQSHDLEGQGISNSQRKLQRLQIPLDLSGKAVLDVGCNEGFFCNVAAERGARKVVGIDFVKGNIDVACRLYSRDHVTFIHQTWSSLPEGPFDLVIWSSAMHYELDPKSVFKDIYNKLTPDGLMILECGVINQPSKEMVPVPRQADTRWYPTMPFLREEILDGFVVRQVAQPEIAFGDLVPRSVFHCSKRMPIVLLISGDSKDGKTTLATTLSKSSSKQIILDMIVSRLALSKHPHNDLEKIFVDYYDPNNLGKIYLAIDEKNLTNEYAEFIAQGICSSDDFVTIEGFITNKQAEILQIKLASKAVVWNAQRFK